MERTQVVIIGGGATGAGLLWDLALRGIPAVLLEKKDLANGATGRCHGLLHSGARYVVKDPSAAGECVAENQVLKKIAACCVHDTGGLFVQLRSDDPHYMKEWISGCERVGIPTQALSRDEVLALEPNLPSDLVQAQTTPDAHIDTFQLVLANVGAAVCKGARFRTYAEVTSIETNNGHVKAVRYRDVYTGEEQTLGCEVVVNAAGGWAQQVAAMAGAEVPVRCDRGALLVFNQRLVDRIVNRCRKPGDADILVPAGPVCILGTSSVTIPGPDNLTVAPEEVRQLLGLGAQLVPALADARLLRVFTGVRPLYAPKNGTGAEGREISRNFALIDHSTGDNVGGLISIVGGKLTTYRLMAKAVADLICHKLAINSTCTTDQVPLRSPAENQVLREAQRLLPSVVVEKAHRRLGQNLAYVVEAIKADQASAELICECELVTRAEVDFVLGHLCSVPAVTIADVGRRTRLGFGPCQGTFCGYKAMLAGYASKKWSAKDACRLFEDYLDERWKGQSWVPEGKQAEQLSLSRDLFDTSYNFHAMKGR